MISVLVDDSRAQGMLGTLHGRVVSDLLDEAADDLVEYQEEVFATGGFGAWAPLDPKTVALKGSSRILVDTGGLLRDLTARPKVRGDSAEVSTDHAGAPHLKAGARGMPKRDPSPAPHPRVLHEWSQGLLDTLVQGLGS